MAANDGRGNGTAADPWVLQTPPGTDEQKPANDGTVEAWGELEHNPRNNRMRAT